MRIDNFLRPSIFCCGMRFRDILRTWVPCLNIVLLLMYSHLNYIHACFDHKFDFYRNISVQDFLILNCIGGGIQSLFVFFFCQNICWLIGGYIDAQVKIFWCGKPFEKDMMMHEIQKCVYHFEIFFIFVFLHWVWAACPSYWTVNVVMCLFKVLFWIVAEEFCLNEIFIIVGIQRFFVKIFECSAHLYSTKKSGSLGKFCIISTIY